MLPLADSKLCASVCNILPTQTGDPATCCFANRGEAVEGEEWTGERGGTGAWT